MGLEGAGYDILRQEERKKRREIIVFSKATLAALTKITDMTSTFPLALPLPVSCIFRMRIKPIHVRFEAFPATKRDQPREFEAEVQQTFYVHHALTQLTPQKNAISYYRLNTGGPLTENNRDPLR